MLLLRILFSLALGAISLAAQDREAEALLRKVAAHYRELRQFRFESVIETEMSSGNSTGRTLQRVMLAQAPAFRLRLEWEQDRDSLSVFQSGRDTALVDPALARFSRAALETVPDEARQLRATNQWGRRALALLAASRTRYTGIADHLKTAGIARSEALSFAGREVRCQVVEASYASEALKGRGIDRMLRTFWVDPERLLVIREEMLTERVVSWLGLQHRSRERATTTLSVATVDGPLPTELFRYTPPENFTEVDEFGKPVPKPGADVLSRVAPEVMLTSLEGNLFSISDFRGRVVLLDFWATWCAPCRQQMPDLVKLREETREQGLVFLGINDDRSPEIARRYVYENKLDWRHLYDGERQLARERFKVEGIPTLVLIDRDGVVVDFQMGALPESEASIRRSLVRLGFKLEPK